MVQSDHHERWFQNGHLVRKLQLWKGTPFAKAEKSKKYAEQFIFFELRVPQTTAIHHRHDRCGISRGTRVF